MRHFCLIFFICSFSINIFSQKSFVERSGDIIQIGIPIIALGSTFIFENNDKPYWQFIKAFGVSFIATHTLKRIINKKRPGGGNYSFPSGHTSAAFNGAAFIQKRYGWKYGFPAYLLASYVGYSRIYAKKHDVYDVIAGASIGFISSYLFTKAYKNNKIKISLNSNLNKDTIAISLNYSL